MRLPLLLILLSLPARLDAAGVVRVNILGYPRSSVKVAVAMLDSLADDTGRFEVRGALDDSVVFRGSVVRQPGSWGGYQRLVRLDFSALTRPGGYVVTSGRLRSPAFRIGDDVYDGAADFLLGYMRQQRSGFNPFLGDSCHTHDGYVIYRPGHDSEHVDVWGGWHDASDYLQYVTTSASATYQMLSAYSRYPGVFADRYGADGLPGANGVADILDEAGWGMRWLAKMNPEPDVMYNQIADDRDHQGFRLPTEDPVSYGRGRERPVYFCTGAPQGLGSYTNRSSGLASTAGKFASAFALYARITGPADSARAMDYLRRARAAYALGKDRPGVCQTAPNRAPYFYEEENWLDDMELAAAQLGASTGVDAYFRDAEGFGRKEPVNPWMGEDTARHYQWYPFINLAHAVIAEASPARRSEFAGYLREGIERVRARAAHNPFAVGTPFIWCSNNYVSAFLAQALLYRELTRETTYVPLESAARDWLFGCNPWGTSMVVGLPRGGESPRDPHSAFSHLHGFRVDGGLVDGPVKSTIFNSLRGVQLSRPDRFARFQGDAVYHDDWGDYSTNEPTMDGTAGLVLPLASIEHESHAGKSQHPVLRDAGGIIRGDTTRKIIYLCFSGHEFSGDGLSIERTLRAQKIRASFFFTGAFYRQQRNHRLIMALHRAGHYLGPHSNAHLLYAPWEKRDSLLIDEGAFTEDLRGNFEAMRPFGLTPAGSRFFLPPFEWYNQAVADWSKRLGLTLVNFTPGTSSNADYTTPGMGASYRSSGAILKKIFTYESAMPAGLNGHILLMHIGTDPARTDKLSDHLPTLLTELKRRGYQFRPISDIFGGRPGEVN
jgi:endoglucanase